MKSVGLRFVPALANAEFADVDPSRSDQLLRCHEVRPTRPHLAAWATTPPARPGYNADRAALATSAEPSRPDRALKFLERVLEVRE